VHWKRLGAPQRGAATQNISSHFDAAPPPTPPPKGKKEGEEMFWLLRRYKSIQKTAKLQKIE
jgi:hypothetical protein